METIAYLCNEFGLNEGVYATREELAEGIRECVEDGRVDGFILGMIAAGAPETLVGLLRQQQGRGLMTVNKLEALVTAFKLGQAHATPVAPAPVPAPVASEKVPLSLPHGVTYLTDLEIRDCKNSMTGAPIEAIKSIRTRTNLRLQEAREVVDAYVERLRTHYTDAGAPAPVAPIAEARRVHYRAPPGYNPVLPYDVSLTESEAEDCYAGDKIYAIKGVRNRTNLSLIRSKDVVDAFCAGLVPV